MNDVPLHDNVQSLWAVTLLPGKPLTLPSGHSYRLQNVSLGREIVSQVERTELVLSFFPALDGLNCATMCVLTPSKVEQISLSMALGSSQTYELTVNGPNSMSVVGSCSEPLDLSMYSLGGSSPSPSPSPLAKPTGTSGVPDGVSPIFPQAVKQAQPTSTIPCLHPASGLVIRGSRIGGLIAVRIEGTRAWLCINKKFSGVVVGSGYLPRELEMKMLGAVEGTQREVRLRADTITEWMNERNYKASPSDIVVIVVGVLSVVNGTTA